MIADRHLRLAHVAAKLIGQQADLASRRRLVAAWRRHLVKHLSERP